MTPDHFKALRALTLPSGKPVRYLSLPALEQAGLGRISRLPVTLRIMLESLARNCDGRRVTREHVEALASWRPNGRRSAEVPVILRLDTPAEVECFRQGGLLPGYLRTLMNAP